MATRNAFSPSLAALMSAAAALAPSAYAQTATSAASDSRVGYRYNEYDEDSFDGPAIGSPERYGLRSNSSSTHALAPAVRWTSPPRTR